MIEQPRSEKTLIFIPTYNDVEFLPEIIKVVRELDDDYVPLVIDDGSSPRLNASDLPKGCLLFSLPDNMGLGMCTHIALDHGAKYGYRALIRIDSDGQHPVAMVPELLSPIRDGTADVVVGTRKNHGDGSGIRIILGKLVKSYFSTIAAWITRGGIPKDVNSGFFALNRDAMVILSSASFERFPEPEMLIFAHKKGLRVTEVSISQTPRRHGKTTLSIPHAARMIYRFSIYAAAELISFRK
jgi:glycosyltransferase involved in cell wall biosynthesis